MLRKFNQLIPAAKKKTIQHIHVCMNFIHPIYSKFIALCVYSLKVCNVYKFFWIKFYPLIQIKYIFNNNNYHPALKTQKIHDS